MKETYWNREGSGSIALEQNGSGRTLVSYQRLETVLVIEDQADLNMALSLRLEAAGLSVARAHDGVAGLEKIRQLEPDIIILDLRLPRMSGFKLLHEIRKQSNFDEAPIVVMTGDPDPMIESRIYSWGIKRVFRKPVSLRAVVAEVLRTLNDS